MRVLVIEIPEVKGSFGGGLPLPSDVTSVSITVFSMYAHEAGQQPQRHVFEIPAQMFTVMEYTVLPHIAVGR